MVTRPNETTSAEPSSTLEQRSRAVFEESVERLDGRTRSRLTQARHAALDEVRKRRSPGSRWLWAPAGGLVAAAIVAVVMLGRPAMDGAPGAPPLDELEAAAGEENIELLQDVEFYAWLAAQEAIPDANRG